MNIGSQPLCCRALLQYNMRQTTNSFTKAAVSKAANPTTVDDDLVRLHWGKRLRKDSAHNSRPVHVVGQSKAVCR